MPGFIGVPATSSATKPRPHKSGAEPYAVGIDGNPGIGNPQCFTKASGLPGVLLVDALA